MPLISIGFSPLWWHTATCFSVVVALPQSRKCHHLLFHLSLEVILPQVILSASLALCSRRLISQFRQRCLNWRIRAVPRFVPSRVRQSVMATLPQVSSLFLAFLVRYLHVPADSLLDSGNVAGTDKPALCLAGLWLASQLCQRWHNRFFYLFPFIPAWTCRH